MFILMNELMDKSITILPFSEIIRRLTSCFRRAYIKTVQKMKDG